MVITGIWRVGPALGIMGAQALNLHLSVGTHTMTLKGHAEMYYDDNVRRFHSAVQGTFRQDYIPGTTKLGYIFQIQGRLPVYLQGGNPVAAQPTGPENLRVTMVLGPQMKTGTATVDYDDGENGWQALEGHEVTFESGVDPDAYTSTAPTA